MGVSGLERPWPRDDCVDGDGLSMKSAHSGKVRMSTNDGNCHQGTAYEYAGMDIRAGVSGSSRESDARKREITDSEFAAAGAVIGQAPRKCLRH